MVRGWGGRGVGGLGGRALGSPSDTPTCSLICLRFAGGAVPALRVHLRGDAGEGARLHPEPGGWCQNSEQFTHREKIPMWEETWSRSTR